MSSVYAQNLADLSRAVPPMDLGRLLAAERAERIDDVAALRSDLQNCQSKLTTLSSVVTQVTNVVSSSSSQMDELLSQAQGFASSENVSRGLSTVTRGLEVVEESIHTSIQHEALARQEAVEKLSASLNETLRLAAAKMREEFAAMSMKIGGTAEAPKVTEISEQPDDELLAQHSAAIEGLRNLLAQLVGNVEDCNKRCSSMHDTADLSEKRETELVTDVARLSEGLLELRNENMKWEAELHKDIEQLSEEISELWVRLQKDTTQWHEETSKKLNARIDSIDEKHNAVKLELGRLAEYAALSEIRELEICDYFESKTLHQDTMPTPCIEQSVGEPEHISQVSAEPPSTPGKTSVGDIAKPEAASRSSPASSKHVPSLNISEVSTTPKQRSSTGGRSSPRSARASPPHTGTVPRMSWAVISQQREKTSPSRVASKPAGQEKPSSSRWA